MNREALSAPGEVLYHLEPLPVINPELLSAVEALPIVPMVLLTTVPLLMCSVLFVPVLPIVKAPPRLVEPPPLNIVVVLSSAKTAQDRMVANRRANVEPTRIFLRFIWKLLF